MLFRSLADEGGAPALVVAQTVSDLHVVAAVSAWVSTPQAAGDDHAALEPVTAVPEPLAAVRAAVAQVRTATSDGRDLPDLLDQLGRLLDGVRTAADAVLTVLVGDLASAQVVSALTAEAARRCPGIEVVVLASGVRSQVLVMGVDEL